MKTALKILTACSIAVPLVACGDSKELNETNIMKAVQAKLDTEPGLCISLNHSVGGDIGVTKGEYEHGNSTAKKLTALEHAGFLTKTEGMFKLTPYTSPKEGYKFEITDKGKKYLKSDKFYGDAFCSGKLKVTKIDNFSKPGEKQEPKVSNVEYRYKVEDTDSWINDKELRAAHSEDSDFSHFIKGEAAPGLVTLVLTEDGWVESTMLKHKPE